jgi:hypothetical protein
MFNKFESDEELEIKQRYSVIYHVSSVLVETSPVSFYYKINKDWKKIQDGH